jgi:hypothetical protein
MESLLLRGTSASGLFSAKPGLAMCLQGIVMDLPNSGTLTAASVTVSGATTGAFTFNDSVTVTKQFQPNEDVYITTSNFGANYGVIVNYVTTGDMSSYMQTDLTRSTGCGYPTPWRFRT